MKRKGTKIWLRGCKARVYKKKYWSRIDVDGSFITLHQYTEHIIGWKKMKVGDPIFNTFRNRWETLAEIKNKWWKLDRCRNAKYLEITGVTDKGFIVYEYDAEKYALPEEEWGSFKKEWGIPEKRVSDGHPRTRFR